MPLVRTLKGPGEKGKGKGGKEDQNKGTTKFTGTCNCCGKTGHKAAECWWAPEATKGQKAGKGGGKGGKGKKGKGKGKSAGALDAEE